MSMEEEKSRTSAVLVDLGDYEGERNDTGERHGCGKAQLPNGDIYTGNYKYGKRQGQGQYIFSSKVAQYNGHYKEGKRHGPGKMIYPDGSWYEGGWVNNVRQGYGTYCYPNGDKYDGDWFNDLRHGMGTYEYRYGEVQLKGKWVLGKLGGQGEICYSNFSYHGLFQDGRPSGDGKFMFDRGFHENGAYRIENKVKIVDDERFIYQTLQWVTDGKVYVNT